MNGQKHRDTISNLASQILAVKRRNHAADTTALDNDIDCLLYELYGLTPEERAIVEGSTQNRVARTDKVAEPAGAQKP
jgi:hypothetical protein